jgi:glycosidase
MLSPTRGLAAALSLGGLLAFTSAACGDSTASNKDFGGPPDPNAFNPGNGGGDGYGYGTGPLEVVCPAELKRCAHTITYPFNNESSVELRGDFGGPSTWEVGRAMTRNGNVWSVDITVPIDKPIQFKFIVDNNLSDWKVDKTQPTIKDAGGNENNTFAGKTCDPAICEEEGQLPPGVYDWRDSVIYFVFVDRFVDGNGSNNCSVAGASDPSVDYRGGDWAGVTQKINDGYFTNLGVNTLWITVPLDNFDGLGKGAFDDFQYTGSHGYWPKMDNASPTDLQHESCFGSFADLKGLVSSAHKKGIKILFDYAMVHVHKTSAIYEPHKNDWFHPDNCVCGKNGCDWDRDGERCWFTDYLPHWNYKNADARAYSVANAVAWVKQTADEEGNGADGFRADAIKHIDISWLNDLRKKLKVEVTDHQTPKQRFYMVGETYDFGNYDLLKKYIDPTTKLDGQFDFPLRKNIVDATILRKMDMSSLAGFMSENDLRYGSGAVMSTFIGNHDLPRIIHLAQDNPLWGDQGADGKDKAWNNRPSSVGELSAYERLANGFAVIFTSRGAPLVYYGDEIGLPGGGDPDNRRMMQWGGLNSNQTYLRDRIAKLGDIRSKHPALRRGRLSSLGANKDTWVFKRTATEETVYVAINRGDTPSQVSGLPSGAIEDLVTGQTFNGPSVNIPARQTRIFATK